MKKILFIVICVLLLTKSFAQEMVYASDGPYFAGIEYHGQNKGQYLVDIDKRIFEQTKLTNGQLEVVQNMLKKYNTTKGDTYRINFFPIIANHLGRGYIVYCEFTSNTQYNYWAFRYISYY